MYSGKSLLNFQADEAHQLEGVALFHHAIAQFVIEVHGAILDEILEVGVAGDGAESVRDFGEREVVRGDDADGAAIRILLQRPLPGRPARPSPGR